MCSTLLLVGIEEAKTSVVLRFASDCYSSIVEGQIAASVVVAHFLQFPFFMTLHGTVHSLCRAATTRTQLTWLPPIFTKAADARHAEARSPLLIDEVFTKALAIFPLEHNRPEAVDLQLYRSDWHSCLELVDFPLHRNLRRRLKIDFTDGENVWLELLRIEKTQSNAKTALLLHDLDSNLRSCQYL